MDILALVSQDLSTTTTEVVLERDPSTGKPKAGLLVVGMDSPQYQAEDARQRGAAVKRRAEAAKAGVKVDLETEEGANMLQEQGIANMRDRAIACTVGWFGMTANGEELPFDPSMLPKIYSRMSIVMAASDEIGLAANFLPKPPETEQLSTSGNSRGSTRAKGQKA